MGLNEDKAEIKNLSTTNINNKSGINTAGLEVGIANVAENLTSNSLTTKSIEQPVSVKALTVTSGAQVEVLTRTQILNSAIFIYEINISAGATQTIRLPNMTTEDVGLLIRIGKIGDTTNTNNDLTIVASSGDFLNGASPGSVTIIETNNKFRNILLTNVVGGVSYWLSQQI